MTPHERVIAEAAIKAPRRDTYEKVYSHISKATGFDQVDVKSVVERLVADFVLKQRGGPAHNVAEGEQVGDRAQGWFERGEMWKKRTRRSAGRPSS